jgi:sodium transport system permease protein
MNWQRTLLIFMREIRDQLRDRRTMCTIFVLPLLLYPFLGMLMLQVAQFHAEHPVKVTWIGSEFWPSDRPLLSPEAVASEKAKVAWEYAAWTSEAYNEEQWLAHAQRLVKSGKSELVLLTTEGISQALDKRDRPLPIKLVINQASDQSLIANRRLQRLLDDWQRTWLREQLTAVHLDPSILKPIDPETIDVAPKETKQALIWSKLLPLVMLIWALTGAFYPAIDLCAGEKERGTLETLLSSPASRREIVWGKLFTVMTFSVATAVLNLFSMQFTSSFVIQQFTRLGNAEAGAAMGPLPLSALTWLVVILLPISIMFSALALAVAALARSSKEGQYYLMPLLLAGLPLVLLPMIPGITLSVGSSSIPVTGAVLLARALIEGHYREALVHAPIVIGVTVLCCLLAVRWAVRQFESETVMFRESERFDWSLWLKRIWTERGDAATANEAMLCGMVVLVALFFGRLSFSGETITWITLVQSTIAIQIGMILAPCLIMAIFMTSSILKGFRIERVRLTDALAAILLAIALHPAYLAMASFIQGEFQVGVDTLGQLKQLEDMIQSAPLSSVLLVLAVVPAICEELAFRGFIFGGLLQNKGTLRAILLSALLFGFSHGVLQQSISASIMGIVLGVVAWRTGGVICGILTHMTHNALSMSLSRMDSYVDSLPIGLRWIFAREPENQLAYSDAWFVVGTIVAILCLAWFILRPAPKITTK